MKNCYISGGCPNFIVTIRDSAFEKSFKRKYHKAVWEGTTNILLILNIFREIEMKAWHSAIV